MWRIYINNELIDGECSMEVVKSIFDFTSLDATGTITKDLAIPSSINNDNIFGMIYDLTSLNYDLNIKIPIIIYNDNYTVLTGYFQLTSVIKENDVAIEYQGTAYGDNNILFTNIKDKKMSDLDLSELNFILTDDFVYKSYLWWGLESNPYTPSEEIYKNIAFPYIDYGKGTNGYKGSFSATTSACSCADVYPALKVNYLFNKIFEEAGCTYESKFMTSDEFETIIEPFSNELVQIVSGQTNSLLESVGSYVDIRNYKLYEDISLGGSSVDSWSHKFKILDTSVNYDLYNIAQPYVYTWNYHNTAPMLDTTLGIVRHNFTYRPYQSSIYTSTDNFTTSTVATPLPSSVWFHRKCKIKLTVSLDFINKVWNSSQNIPSWFKISKSKKSDITNISPYDRITFDNVETDIKVVEFDMISFPSNFTLSLTETFEVDVDDVIYSKLIIGPIPYLSLGGQVKCTEFNIEIIEEYLENTPVLMENFYKDKTDKVVDFFNDIMKMFNLFIYPDKIIPKHYHIETYNDLFNDKSDVFYIHEQLDHIEEQIDFQNNFKNLKFSYKEDDDYYNKLYKTVNKEQYGDATYEFVNEWNTEDKELTLNYYSPSICSYIPTWAIIPSTNTWDTITTKIYQEENGGPKFINYNDVPNTKCNPRILYFDMKHNSAQEHLNRRFNFNISIGVANMINYPFATNFYPNANNGFLSGGTQYEFPEEMRSDLNFSTYTLPFKPYNTMTNNNLVNRYYKKYIEQIGSSITKLYKCSLNLTPDELNLIDITKYIYIEERGYFIISEMRMTPNELVEMDLIYLADVEVSYQRTRVPFLDVRPWNYFQSGNNTNAIYSSYNSNLVLGENNYSSNYEYRDDYLVTTATTYVDASGNTSSTWIPNSTAYTYSGFTYQGTDYIENRKASFILGDNNTIKKSGSFVIGDNCITTSKSIVIGGTGIYSDENIHIGQSGKSLYIENSEIYLGNSSTTIYVGGNALSSITCAGVDGDVQVNIGGQLSAYTLRIETTSTNMPCLNFGRNNTANSKHGLTFGYLNQVINYDTDYEAGANIAIGSENVAQSTYYTSMAVGNNNQSLDDNCYTFGNDNIADTNKGAFAFGSSNIVEGDLGVAFGKSIHVTGDNSFGIGEGYSYLKPLIVSGNNSFNFSKRGSSSIPSGVTGDYSLIFGGTDNSVTGNYSGIISSVSSIIRDDYSVILGGASNECNYSFNAILGGSSNIANATNVCMINCEGITANAEYTTYIGGGLVLNTTVVENMNYTATTNDYNIYLLRTSGVTNMEIYFPVELCTNGRQVNLFSSGYYEILIRTTTSTRTITIGFGADYYQRMNYIYNKWFY